MEHTYRKHCLYRDGSPRSARSFLADTSPEDLLPVNTHGGLLSFGAPWETPAMYNVIEAYAQLTGTAGSRQVPNARRALVYGRFFIMTEIAVFFFKNIDLRVCVTTVGNGGVFSASAVAILGRGEY